MLKPKLNSIGNVSSLVFETLSNTKEKLILFSPFIKTSALTSLLDSCKKDIELTVVVRWLPEDILKGVSDLDVFKLVEEFGGRLLVNNQIHLKLFVMDNKTILIGSSNITNKGLGLAENHNIEAMTESICSDYDTAEIEKILGTSTLVNLEIYQAYKSLLEDFGYLYEEKIPKELKNRIKIISNLTKKEETGLYVSSLPLTSSPYALLESIKNNRVGKDENHDILLFGGDTELELGRAFIDSNCYKWQKKEITGKTLFGKYAEKLHNVLLDDPTPYRKTVKDLTSNMFEWTRHFSQEFIFEKQNYTVTIEPVSSYEKNI